MEANTNQHRCSQTTLNSSFEGSRSLFSGAVSLRPSRFRSFYLFIYFLTFWETHQLMKVRLCYLRGSFYFAAEYRVWWKRGSLFLVNVCMDGLSMQNRLCFWKYCYLSHLVYANGLAVLRPLSGS